MKNIIKSLCLYVISLLIVTMIVTVPVSAVYELTYDSNNGKYSYVFNGETRYTDQKDVIPIKTAGTYEYEYAFEYLELVNKLRAEKGLKPWIVNKEMTEEAMYRSNEASIYFKHERPDGSKLLYSEVLAGGSTPLYSYNLLVNSPSHLKALLWNWDDENAIYFTGIGCFKSFDGYIYLCQNFYIRYDDGNEYAEEKKKGIVTQSDYPASTKVSNTIAVSPSLVDTSNWKTTIESLNSGGSWQLESEDKESSSTIFKYGDNSKKHFSVDAPLAELPSPNLTFTSTNSSVVKIDSSGNFTIGNAGTATIKATLKEDPSVYFERKITVKPKELWEGYFNLSETKVYYNGSEQKPKVENNNSFVEGKDYAVTYQNNIGSSEKVTVGRVIITGINNYTGSFQKTFRIYNSLCTKYDSRTGSYLYNQHSYSTQWTIDTPATCTSEGSKSHHCTVCGEKSDVTAIPKTSHTFGEWKTTKQATCTADGVQTRTCSGCGKTETKAITATGHSYTSKITKQPTCANDGVRTYTCSKCGNSYTEAIKATGHKYSTEWTTDKNATCTTEGSKSHHCTVCGDKTDVTVIPKVAHTYSDYVVEKKPTCTETGIRSYKCTVCGQSIREEIPKLDHNYSSEEILSPTCVDTGSVLLTCSECGESHVEAVPAKGHNYTTKVVRPSYTTQGYTIHTCTECGYSYKDNYTAKLVLGNVSGFKVPVTNANAVKLTWNKTKNATGYIVYRYNTSAKKWSRIAKIKTNIYIDKKLASGTTYKYAVKAYRTEGNKEATSPKYPTVTTTTLPANVNFKLASARGKTVVKWSKTRGATGYVVYYKTSAKGKWSRLKVTKGTSYTTTKLRRGRTYYFTVRAYKNLNGKNYYGSFTTKKIMAK